MLLDEEQKNALPPPFPPALFVATLLAGALLVYTTFNAKRGGSALGLTGEPLRYATYVALVGFFGLLSYGAWRARRLRRT
ncbi:MAG TPA: hypothetical protein VM370_05605 [Candidatus Thermoplasmatota archaeon]|nr:hypothetical protein [Candidatus Thermoplasmatota archaeon]